MQKRKVNFQVLKRKPVNSLFDFVLYFLKDSNLVIVEDTILNKSFIASEYTLPRYFSFLEIKTDWKRIPDGTYIKLEPDCIKQFVSLNQEKIMFQDLSFQLDFNKSDIPADKLMFSCENFQYETRKIKYDDILTFNITANLPIFQLYGIFTLYNDNRNILPDMICMKYNKTFYRYPYGNISSMDKLCLSSTNLVKNRIESYYAKLLLDQANFDYGFHLKYNNSAKTCLDLDEIKKKINDNNEVSLLDTLYYLSQCRSVDDINLNIFLLSPNIPEKIIEYENEGELHED